MYIALPTSTYIYIIYIYICMHGVFKSKSSISRATAVTAASRERKRLFNEPLRRASAASCY